MPELKDTKARIIQLRAQLNEHSYLYHALNAPVLTDAEYDKLFTELHSLEKIHPELADVNSPTSRVGFASPSSFQKVKHASKMLSLDNAFDAKTVLNFFKAGTSVAVEPKIDGFSLELVYSKGSLVQAVTRGDGAVGDDVTANARTIFTVPLVLTAPLSIRVRGEAYMTYSAFSHLNDALESSGDELFANARNAAAGSIKLKNPSEVFKRKLSFVAYGTEEIKGVKTQADLIEYLQSIGFSSITTLPATNSMELPPLAVTLVDEAQLTKVIEDMDVYRKQLDLATDGLVFKVNDMAAQRDLGEGTRFPYWAVAYKYPPERKFTKLADISVRVGKTGKITPVAELEPISLSGTVVTFASLCNSDEIDRLGCNIGDSVWVEKSAEIIPKIMGVHKKVSKSPWKMPETCPSCATKLIRYDGLVDTYCPNSDCSEQVYARLTHALGKSALDVDGCGDVAVREIMNHGVRTLSDFFAAPDFAFMKPAARRRIMASREVAKGAPLWRKLHALGIDGIGRTMCHELAGRWNALYAMFDDIDSLRGLLGEVRFNSFVSFMTDNTAELDKLDALGVIFEDDSKAIGSLTGKSFVITGTLVSGKRDEVAHRIEEAGGTVKNAVTKSVTYLVTGEECGRVKIDAAKKVGAVAITEEQLYQLMEKPMPVISLQDAEPQY